MRFSTELLVITILAFPLSSLPPPLPASTLLSPPSPLPSFLAPLPPPLPSSSLYYFFFFVSLWPPRSCAPLSESRGLYAAATVISSPSTEELSQDQGDRASLDAADSGRGSWTSCSSGSHDNIQTIQQQRSWETLPFGHTHFDYSGDAAGLWASSSHVDQIMFSDHSTKYNASKFFCARQIPSAQDRTRRRVLRDKVVCKSLRVRQAAGLNPCFATFLAL